MNNKLRWYLNIWIWIQIAKSRCFSFNSLRCVLGCGMNKDIWILLLLLENTLKGFVWGSCSNNKDVFHENWATNMSFGIILNSNTYKENISVNLKLTYESTFIRDRQKLPGIMSGWQNFLQKSFLRTFTTFFKVNEVTIICIYYMYYYIQCSLIL